MGPSSCVFLSRLGFFPSFFVLPPSISSAGELDARSSADDATLSAEAFLLRFFRGSWVVEDAGGGRGEVFCRDVLRVPPGRLSRSLLFSALLERRLWLPPRRALSPDVFLDNGRAVLGPAPFSPPVRSGVCMVRQVFSGELLAYCLLRAQMKRPAHAVPRCRKVAEPWIVSRSGQSLSH